MSAITGTKNYAGEFAGEVRLLTVRATLQSASDTITLTPAAHGGVTEIVDVVGAVITGGMDDDFQAVQVSFSGLVLTVVSTEGDGTAAEDFTGHLVTITLLIKTTA